MDEIKGTVFDIQHYSIHDGPGIRTNVFMKGCPLHCLWCQNPESQSTKPQIMYTKSKCTGCGSCIKICSSQAITLTDEHISITDREKCIGCQECVEVCTAQARTAVGKLMGVKEVYDKVKKDKLFYDGSGGGVTITGGEALSQPEFVHNLFKLCKENSINTAIETCGFAKWDTVKYVLEYVDYVLYDIKNMNPEKHKSGTGVTNELILSNIIKISKELKKDITVRMPVIPEFNDSEENVEAMAKFVSENLPTCSAINLLPYHNMGEGKKEQLEEKLNDFSSHKPEENEMDHLKEIISQYNVPTK